MKSFGLALGTILWAIAMSMAVSAKAAETELPSPGPQGPLHGSHLSAGKDAPVVLIIPGSGPTDRDGNSRLGVQASTYRHIAEGLAARGISSVRIDKRGMFGSAGAIPDANAVTIADYATDVAGWASTILDTTGARCVWLLGHSEGVIVALTAAQEPDNICGLLLVAGPGRKMGDIMREQLKANPANWPILPLALPAIDTLEAGGTVNTTLFPAPLAALFRPDIQPFLRDLFRIDPTSLAARVETPILILQGDADIQISVTDAQLLSAANPAAELKILPDTNHVLKRAPKDDRAANIATYSNPNLPLAPGVIDAIVGFIER